MYSVGLFYAWDFFALIILTVSYIYAPDYILDKKKPYITFILTFLSIVFTVFLILYNIIQDREVAHMLFLISLCPLLFIYHLVYPFKKVKRSKHLSFFLFFLSGYILMVRGLILIGFLFSNM